MQSFSIQYKKEITEIEAQIGQSKIELSNLEKTVQKALVTASSLDTLWKNGTYYTRVKLQKIMFPEGLQFHKEMPRYRTKNINSFIGLTHTLSVNCGETINGFSDGEVEESALVPRAGVEPAQPCSYWCLRPARLPIPPSGL